ncbi:MAG: hypothetical protein AAGA12_00785 [Pseudomonadota bacterium]
MFWALLRSIRLFWVSFCVAVSALVWTGIYSGSFTRADLQLGMIQRVASFLEDHPEVVGWSLAAMGYQTATLTAEETEALPQSSLDALKARQRATP